MAQKPARSRWRITNGRRSFVLRHRPQEERHRPRSSFPARGDRLRSTAVTVSITSVARLSYELREGPAFKVTDTMEHFDVIATLNGGGISGQAGALRHGIARALLEAGDYRGELKRAAGYHARLLHGGARSTPASRRPRKRPQFSKR